VPPLNCTLGVEVKLQLNSREGAPAKIMVDEHELEISLAEVAQNAKSAGQRHLVELKAENGNSLSLALGGEETVLVFGRPEKDPPYYTSRGAEDTIDPLFVCHYLGKHYTEVPRRFVISLDQAVRAVKEFAATRELPLGVVWEET
jgi:Immunity protein Imm1